MKRICFTIMLLLLIVATHSCKNQHHDQALSGKDFNKVISEMSTVMIHDVTNPPLAARFFAYTCLSGYEIISENDRQVKSMNGVLNQYPVINKPVHLNRYDFRLSAVLAMYQTAEGLQPSGSTLLAKKEQLFIDSCKKIGFDDDLINNSHSYAQVISKKILAYAKSDNYNRTSNYRRYTPSGKPGSWDPTPPSYMAPVEPYFNTIRSFTLDSATQFVPEPPIPFSTKTHSAFYKFLQLSYLKCGSTLAPEEKTIANFWDCNPFAVQNDGHMLIGLKKISPGAHWMGIAAIACDQTKASFSKTIEVSTMVAIGLTDGFICCWEDKYRTNRIRPETAIRKYIDPNWKPFLQTPPFPEYISGHSVVSAASAVILTYYFGDNFHYIDNVEVNFGIPPRKFNSFSEAAKEAAISRFWGGIHFMDAIDNGIIQGTEIGNWVLNKVNRNE